MLCTPTIPSVTIRKVPCVVGKRDYMKDEKEHVGVEDSFKITIGRTVTLL